MGFNKVGDWEKVSRLIRELAPEFQRARQKCLKQFGLKAEAVAKKHMSSQDLAWIPLKPATIAAKIRKGQSENILIASSSYFQSVTSWVVDKTAYAGVKREAKNAETGEAIANIAAVQEFGSQSRSIPARPLWEPTAKQVFAWQEKENNPAQLVLDELNKKYK